MRRFRFVGEPLDYAWKILPVVGDSYSIEEINSRTGFTITLSEDDLSEKEWQEVLEPTPKPLHKDTDLGYYAGLAISGLLSNPGIDTGAMDERDIANAAIVLAKQLIKQLDEQSHA